MSGAQSAWHSALKPFCDVGENPVRLLRDGREAFPAMLEAIDMAPHEVLLEMYWVCDDAVGTCFRDPFVMRAQAGAAVIVTYDAAGSMGLARRFWDSLVRAGGHVLEYGPAVLFLENCAHSPASAWHRLGHEGPPSSHCRCTPANGRDACECLP